MNHSSDKKIIESANGMKSNTFVTMQSVFVVLLLVVSMSGCRSMPQRDIAISQINRAEQKLQNANTAEANIYMSEKYLEASTLLRRARNSMQSEEYSQSSALAQRSQEVALEAMQQTEDERKNVKALAARLLFSANEAWESYAQSPDKEYASDELIAIRKLLDSAQEEINTKEYMGAFKKAQRAHGEISKLPEAVEKGRIIRLEEEKKRIKARKNADEIIAAAHQQAENILAEVSRQREQLLAETAELAAYARHVEFERMFPSTYLVKRSETLIDISRRHEIYNDQFMWPLLYKANRDQIRDPKVVFPDQVLSIPRDITYADIIEARKMAEAAPPYDPPSTAYNPEVFQRYMQILPPSPFISEQEAGPKLEP